MARGTAGFRRCSALIAALALPIAPARADDEATAADEPAADDNARGDDESRAADDKEAFVPIEVRAGVQYAAAPGYDRNYWPLGLVARLQVIAPALTSKPNDTGHEDTEFGLTFGFELHSFDDDTYRSEELVPDELHGRETDPLWGLDLGLFGRRWLVGYDIIRFGVEARLGLGFTSGAEIRYLYSVEIDGTREEQISKLDRAWGIGPSAGGTLLLGVGTLILGGGARASVADGVISAALLVTIGVVTAPREAPQAAASKAVCATAYRPPSCSQPEPSKKPPPGAK